MGSKPKHASASKTEDNNDNEDSTLIMAQMIATFSHLEQSRFAAFTRAAISTTALREWTATVVGHRTQTKPNRIHMDEDISLVVSMAAKSFAQRLLSQVGPVVTAEKVYAAASSSAGTSLFLQGSCGGDADNQNREWERKRLAALQAQEAYDEEMRKEDG